MTTIICTGCLAGYVQVNRIGCHCGGEFVQLVTPIPFVEFDRLGKEQRLDLKVRRLELPTARRKA